MLFGIVRSTLTPDNGLEKRNRGLDVRSPIPDRMYIKTVTPIDGTYMLTSILGTWVQYRDRKGREEGETYLVFEG